MSKASPLFSNFNSGELSPLLFGRADFEKYPNGASRMLNFIPTTQGPNVRRAGTMFGGQTKNNSKVLLVPFEYSVTQAYVLEFGNLYVRFWTFDPITKVRGLLMNGGVPVEVVTPYAQSDLFNADGTPALAFAQSGDFMYLAHRRHRPRLLKRVTATSFEIEVFQPKGGPFEDLITDDATLTYSATEGDTVIKSDRPIFLPEHVGSLLQIERDSANSIPPWEVDKDVSAGDLRRSDGSVYTALNGGKTGSNRPVHKEGSMSDGTVTWEYTDSGIGYLLITEYVSETEVKGEVQDALPAEHGLRVVGITWTGGNNFRVTTSKPHGLSNGDIVRIGGVKDTMRYKAGAINRYVNNYVNGEFTVASVDSTSFVVTKTGYVVASYSYSQGGAISTSSGTMDIKTSRYAFGAWSEASGYPSAVAFFRERLWFARDQRVWGSVSADFSDFSAKQYGEITDDMAISVMLTSGRINDVQWMAGDKDLVIGTSGAEFGLGELSNGDPLGPSNRRLSLMSQFGSRAIIPIKNNESLFFVTRSGLKARETYYDFGSDGYKSTDLTVLSEHITRSGLVAAAFQADPDMVVWCIRADGTLVGFTWNNEQQVRGWHPHDVGGQVQSIATIPAAEGDRSELWMCVKRNIDGQDRYYVEYMARPFRDGDDVRKQIYSDSALVYDGPATKRINGLEHLIGKEVSVLSDGAPHPNVTVDEEGGIELQRAASVVVAGLPYKSFWRSMPIEAGARDGTAQGKTKRIHKVVYRFYNTGSATAWSGSDDCEKEQVVFRAAGDAMSKPVPLYTGDKIISWAGGYDSTGYIALEVNQPVACTLIAVMPQVHTYDAR